MKLRRAVSACGRAKQSMGPGHGRHLDDSGGRRPRRGGGGGNSSPLPSPIELLKQQEELKRKRKMQAEKAAKQVSSTPFNSISTPFNSILTLFAAIQTPFSRRVNVALTLFLTAKQAPFASVFEKRRPVQAVGVGVNSAASSGVAGRKLPSPGQGAASQGIAAAGREGEQSGSSSSSSSRPGGAHANPGTADLVQQPAAREDESLPRGAGGARGALGQKREEDESWLDGELQVENPRAILERIKATNQTSLTAF